MVSSSCSRWAPLCLLLAGAMWLGGCGDKASPVDTTLDDGAAKTGSDTVDVPPDLSLIADLVIAYGSGPDTVKAMIAGEDNDQGVLTDQAIWEASSYPLTLSSGSNLYLAFAYRIHARPPDLYHSHSHGYRDVLGEEMELCGLRLTPSGKDDPRFAYDNQLQTTTWERPRPSDQGLMGGHSVRQTGFFTLHRAIKTTVTGLDEWFMYEFDNADTFLVEVVSESHIFPADEEFESCLGIPLTNFVPEEYGNEGCLFSVKSVDGSYAPGGGDDGRSLTWAQFSSGWLKIEEGEGGGADRIYFNESLWDPVPDGLRLATPYLIEIEEVGK